MHTSCSIYSLQTQTSEFKIKFTLDQLLLSSLNHHLQQVQSSTGKCVTTTKCVNQPFHQNFQPPWAQQLQSKYFLCLSMYCCIETSLYHVAMIVIINKLVHNCFFSFMFSMWVLKWSLCDTSACFMVE